MNANTLRIPWIIIIISVLIGLPDTLEAGITTWDGSTDTDWFDSTNWSSGVPDRKDSVTIPSGLTNYPALNANGGICKSLTIQSGASLSLSTYTLQIRRNLDPQATGVISSSATGKLQFAGSAHSSVNNPFSFTGIISVNKSNFNKTVTFNADVTMGELEVLAAKVALSDGSARTQTITGDVTVSVGATLERNLATLDIGGDVTISGSWDDSNATGGTFVAGNWTRSGTFTIGTQTVTFDGGGTSTISASGSSDFYNITITSSTTANAISAVDINGTLTINGGSVFDADGNLDVSGGAVTCSGTGRLQIGSTVTSLGTFTAGSGTVEYDSTSANQTIETATYNDLEIDKSSFTASASSTFTVSDDLTIASGTMDISSTGDVTVTDVVSVTGALTMTGAGDLRLGNSLTVNSGGSFTATGTSRPTVTNDGSGDYTFTVSSGGTINVKALNFYNPESTGMTINSGATITDLRNIDFQTVDPDADGSNDTFLRVLDSGSTQYRFINLSFDSTCTFNVETASGTSINIEMLVPNGARGTETYENEGTADSIDWPGFTKVWVGGTASLETNWDEADNWSPTGVPTSSDDCLIPSVTHDPVLNANGSVNAIYIDTGGQLNISAANTLTLGSDLIRHQSGTFSMTNGTLNFNGTGTQNLDDESGSTITVYNLTVNKSSGTFSSTSNITVSNNFTLTAGTVAISSFTYTVTGTTDVDGTLTITTGTFDANGTFDATSGTVTFSGAGRLQLGGTVTSLGTFTANASTVEYDNTSGDETIENATYNHLEIDVSGRTASAGSNLTLNGDLTVTSGTLALVTYTVTVAGATDVNATVTITTGTLDANGTFDATGGTVTFSGAGRLQLGDTVTSLGTFTASTSTVEYDDTSANQTVAAVTYKNLEIDKSSFIATHSSALTITGTLTMTTGTLDVGGTFNATGGNVTFGAGRLQLGGSVTSLGTFTKGTGTVEYDDASADQTVAAVNYFDLEIDNSSRVALSGGDVTVSDDLTITSGELEVDDNDTLQVDDDVIVSGTLDLEPGSTLKLAAATTLIVGGTFEALGADPGLIQVTSSDTATPGRYTFIIGSGGIIKAQFIFFQYMDSNGIQITDDTSVTALTQLDDAFFDNGASGGRLLWIIDNDNAVTLSRIQFFNNGSPTYNVETSGATATITIDPYDDDSNSEGFGGPTNENDNGSGTVTPGFIIWGTTTPALLGWFETTRVEGGVLLEWETVSERRVIGFSVERALDKGRSQNHEFTPLWPPAIQATGSPQDGEFYQVVDQEAHPSLSYLYQLVEIGGWGRRRIARARVDPWHQEDPLPTVEGISCLNDLPHGSGRRTVQSRERKAETPKKKTASRHSRRPPHNSVQAVKILVEDEGVIRVPHFMLQEAGFPVESRPTRFHLRRDETPWPITIVGGEDGTFDAGDAIDFVATPFRSLETRYDVYWLEIAEPREAPPRIREVDGRPREFPSFLGASNTKRLWEKDEIYVSSIAEGEGRDHWFWEFRQAPGTFDIPFLLDTVVLGPATLDVRLEGWSDHRSSALDHLTVVSLNGEELAEYSLNGRGPYGGEIEIPEGLLVEGENRLTLEAVELEAPDIVFLDGFTITYPRAHVASRDRQRFSSLDPSTQRLEGFEGDDIVLYQVSGEGSPGRILGGEISGVPGSWNLTAFLDSIGESHYEAFTSAGAKLPAAVLPTEASERGRESREADHIIIAPQGLIHEVEPLARFRRQTGLRVEVVALEEIYDCFDGGRATTDAIRRFIRHAWETWSEPAPRSVLLVGDATYDPRGNLGPSLRQILPARLVETSQFQTASDAWFVDVEGDDGAPEMAIGRLPVATLEECRAVVNKMLRYEREAGGADWNRRAILVADRAIEFLQMNEDVEEFLPMERVALDLSGTSVELLNETLMEEWRRGAGIIHYSGHGGRKQWSSAGILLETDVANLGNGNRLPLVIAMNCLNGYFHHPGSPSLGESLLLEPSGGAIAYWGPTAVTSNLKQQALAESFYRHLFSPGTETLGYAIRLAKREFAEDPEYRTVLETWILLGDPASRLR